MRSSHGLLFACSWLARGSIAAAVLPRQDQDLRAVLTDPSNDWSPKTVISFPESPEFTNATIRWDIFSPPTYKAAVSPGEEKDVITAVKLAREHNIPFLATGGRHGYGTTLGNLDDGLALDLAQLSQVDVDKDAATLTVGAGVRFRDIFDPVYEAGFQIQTGTCSCVGMIGATIGAGIGRLDGVYGLMIDALLSARVVTAEGELLEVSESSHEELFWGIRGAGANFGILVSATYQVHPLVDGGKFTGADLKFPADMNVTFLETVAGMELPPELTVETIMVYNSTTNEPEILVSATFAGSIEKGRKALAPLLDLKPPYEDVKEIPWNELSYKTTFGLNTPVCKDEQVYDVYPINMREFPVDTYVSSFEKMAAFWAEHAEARASVIVLETWPNQAVVAVPDDATAYPWRDTDTYVMLQFRWEDGDGGTAEPPSTQLALELRKDLVAASGYDDLAVYINYAHGDETLEQIYGAAKLPRLAKLKATYDPDNVFAFNNPLPTAYP